MAVNTVEVLRELAQGTDLTQENLGVVLKVLEGNPKFAERLGQGVARQADYSRAMDELRKQQTQIETTAKTQKEWWDTTKPAVEKAVADNAEYEKRFGKLDGSRQPAEGAGLTKAEVEKMLKDSSENGMRFTANVSKQLGFVLQDYSVKFPGKVLDLEAIEKAALDKGITIRAAYDEHIRPDLEAKAKADHEAELKKAREDGAREVMSKHNIPVDSAPSEIAPFFQERPAEGKGLSDAQRARNFRETWETNAGKGAEL